MQTSKDDNTFNIRYPETLFCNISIRNYAFFYLHYRCHFTSSRNNPVKLSMQYVHGCRKLKLRNLQSVLFSNFFFYISVNIIKNLCCFYFSLSLLFFKSYCKKQKIDNSYLPVLLQFYQLTLRVSIKIFVKVTVWLDLCRTTMTEIEIKNLCNLKTLNDYKMFMSLFLY